MTMPIRTIASLCFFGLILAPLAGCAQGPRINAVFPPGARRGASDAVVLTGENLKPVSQVLVSGEGVTARVGAASAGPATADPKKGASSLTLQLQVAADALPGVRELRVMGPDGASNAARIAIGMLPAVIESEPNDQPAEAQSLATLPVTVYGRIDPVGDIDTFRFHAGSGETWVFDLASVSFGSALDGYLSLRDDGGRELATAMEELNRDPRLIHTFEAAGDYTISVRDVEYRGSPEATYALSIGRLPVVTHVLPLALPRGQTTTVQLAGVNLGGMETMTVSVPADYAGDTMTLIPKTAAGVAPPVKLAVSGLPEWVEKEPNDDPAHAMRLPSLPGAVSGVIDHPGDVDVYTFHADSGQKLVFELFGRRLGSRLDSFLRLTDAKGKELASNDDAVGKDSRLEWTAPAAGDYTIQVSDIAGEGGDGYPYRLAITAPPPPDFKLIVTPDLLNMGQGGTEVMTVRAQRLNGFTGDIALRVEELPSGVIASAGTIHIPADAQGDESVALTLTAAADARRQGFPIRVVGTATVAGKPVERVAQPMESYQPPGDEGRRERATLFHVAGVGEPVPYTVAVDPRQVTLAPGATTKLAVKVTRRPDLAAAKAEVNLDVQNVPGGIDVKAPAIPADKSDGEISLKAPEKLEPQTVNLIVRGRIKAMKEMKEARDMVQAAPAVTLVITPPAKVNHEDTKNTKEGK